MSQPLFENVAIVGMGLIGGSIGLATRNRGVAGRVVGIGRREPSLKTALKRGAADEVTTDLATGVERADLAIIASPVGTIVDIARAIAAFRPDILTTDVGSTKAAITASLTGIRFVGSHPMAGDHRTGCAYARGDLLQGRQVFVTPQAESDAADVQRVTAFWQALGATVRIMQPEEHDTIVAAVSHVPHLAASALALSTPTGLIPFAAQGWQDATRTAAGDPGLWSDIAASNRSNILSHLSILEDAIAEIRQAIENEQYVKLQEVLNKAKKKRDALGS